VITYTLPILMDIASFRAAAKKREKERSKSKAIHMETKQQKREQLY